MECIDFNRVLRIAELIPVGVAGRVLPRSGRRKCEYWEDDMIASKVMRYVVVYLLWAVVLLLGLWVFVLSRNDWLGCLGVLYARNAALYVHRVRFLDQVFSLGLGLLWLILMVSTENYFRQGAQKPGLLKRFARVAGPMLLLAFIADLVLLWLQGAPGSGQRWLILAGELAIGMIWLVYARPGPPKELN
jgi:hypothetical protein